MTNEETVRRPMPWGRLDEPLPKEAVKWRQDGKPIQRDGKFFARFVCYVEAGTVRERLDSVVAGEWDLLLEIIPGVGSDHNDEQVVAVKARLQVLGVIREDIGQGRDYKAASTDAFKRAAVRFGIAHELYDYGQNWVEMDGDGRYAKPLEDPAVAYARRHGAPAPVRQATKALVRPSVGDGDVPYGQPETEAPRARAASTGATPPCPKCGGQVWDNRAENDERLARGEKLRPDYKCRDKTCDGVIWRPKPKGKSGGKGGGKGGKSPHSIGADGFLDDDGWVEAMEEYYDAGIL